MDGSEGHVGRDAMQCCPSMQPCMHLLSSLFGGREYLRIYGGSAIAGTVREEVANNKARLRTLVEETPRQGRLEGRQRVSAATHLICGSEGV